MKTRAHVWISGRVQWVGFRAWTEREAQAIGLDGWVRNLDDGRVEAVFEGPAGLVELMVEACRAGPPAAKVEGLDVVWEEVEDVGGFVVLG
jgi:acylphosphatase